MNTFLPLTPTLFKGGLSVDDRGSVSFVNDFTFESVKRFYIIENHRVGYVRAWHAHQYEGKYIFVACGDALVGAVKIDSWQSPSKDAQVKRYVLSSRTPSVLYIPPGYANGAMSLSVPTRIIYFATRSLEEHANDDIRFDARYWDIWNIVER
jgi:dTDP-4-dehydrorhamnose 3,5-epimerase